VALNRHADEQSLADVLSQQIGRQHEEMKELLLELGSQREALTEVIKAGRADKAELQGEVSRVEGRIDELQTQIQQQGQVIEQQTALLQEIRTAQQEAKRAAAAPPPLVVFAPPDPLSKPKGTVITQFIRGLTFGLVDLDWE
jgi:TolA-binding protein